MAVMLLHILARTDGHVAITQSELLILVWVNAWIAAFFTALRSWLQFSHNKRFFTNDLLIGLALAFQMTLSIITHILAPLLYESLDATKVYNDLTALPTAKAEKFLKLQFAALFLVWTALWTVKLAALSFFWRLFTSVRTHARVFWWVMIGITIATWIISIFLHIFACSPASGSFTLDAFLSPKSMRGFNGSFLFASVADIITEFMIMLVPFPLLRNLQMPWRQKAILLVIFLTPLTAIAFAISRITIQSAFNIGLFDPIRVLFYSILEVSVSIIAACLPSLKLFFTNRSTTTSPESPSPRAPNLNINARPPPHRFQPQLNISKPSLVHPEHRSTEAILDSNSHRIEPTREMVSRTEANLSFRPRDAYGETKVEYDSEPRSAN